MSASKEQSNKRRISRKGKSRLVYIGLTLGVVTLAFLCVWLSALLFKSEENALMDVDHYVAVDIISSESVGDPLSLATRVALFSTCDEEGNGRAVLPDEIDEETALEQGRILWNAFLYASCGGRSTLPSGESYLDMIEYADCGAILRDFTNSETGARYALWCVQYWCDSAAGETYCLSVQFDSRTGEPLYLSCALFANINEDTRLAGMDTVAAQLGYSVDPALAEITENAAGCVVSLPLGDTLLLQKTCIYGSQFLFELKPAA